MTTTKTVAAEKTTAATKAKAVATPAPVETVEVLALKKGELLVPLSGGDPWGKSMQLVDFPVMIKPLYFEHQEAMQPAVGTTNTERDTEYLGVVVDRQKDGSADIIATVTDTYGTIPPAQVYEMLMLDLSEMGVVGKPSMLYVSGNGGRQVLTVDIEGQLSPNCKDEIGMQVKLFTSLDGSKRHQLQLVAFDKTNNVEFVGIGTESFNLSTRHTKSIGERHIPFAQTLNNVIQSWNETLMPFMGLMGDAVFDRATAVALLTTLTEDAKLATTHIKSAENAYLSKMMDEGGEHSIYTVMSSLSKYVQDQAMMRPESAERMRAQLDKVAPKHIANAMKQLGIDPKAPKA